MRDHRYAEDEMIAMTVMMYLVEEEKEPHRGSVFGRRVIPRDRHSAYLRLMNDYFVDNPVYPEYYFRRRCIICCFMSSCSLCIPYGCAHCSYMVAGLEWVETCLQTSVAM
jgi:hypothetical protein